MENIKFNLSFCFVNKFSSWVLPYVHREVLPERPANTVSLFKKGLTLCNIKMRSCQQILFQVQRYLLASLLLISLARYCLIR